ncbi:alpha/beta-hydrolase, partial [Macrolepiota fuliginosa MF-IS2]
MIVALSTIFWRLVYYSMANWDSFSHQGVNVASSATSFGLSTAKRGTRFGFGLARGIAGTAIGLTSGAVDHALFQGDAVVRPAATSAFKSVLNMAELVALGSIQLSEYVTSTSFTAAKGSINALSSIFPGSSEASFSLASFITLVKREWSDRDGNLPSKNYGLTQIAKAIIAWVALQGVTQEWQEKRWFKYLRELDVNEKGTTEPERPITRPRRDSRVHVTSDVIFPGQGGPQIIAAQIGEASSNVTPTTQSRNSTLPPPAPRRPPPPIPSRAQTFSGPPASSSAFHSYSSSLPHQLPPSFPIPEYPESTQLSHDELKSTLRRLSKMVLAGYGGASLLFFGIRHGKTAKKGDAGEKREEEENLEVAVDAAEAEAVGDGPETQPEPKCSWWDQLIGKYDKEIFEHAARSADEEMKKKDKKKGKGKAAEKEKEAKIESTAVAGTEFLMPRFWVLTDYNRKQVVLVIRGTVSLNEIAVDLTCSPKPFHPAQPQDDIDEDDEEEEEEEYKAKEKRSPLKFFSRKKPKDQQKKSSPYFVHSGMLRMAKAMGNVGKPVHVAVQDALYQNPGFELVLCGHSLGAGVAAILGMMWADVSTCLTVASSGLPSGRRVSVYCFAPPALIDSTLGRLAQNMITSIVNSNDVVGRLSLGTVRDLRNAALWLCEAEEGKHKYGQNGEKLHEDGYSAVTKRAKRWKETKGSGNREDMDWLIAVRKTLEANMHGQTMFPPGRVLWAMRDSDLHPAHQVQKMQESTGKGKEQDKLRLFEVLDVEKVFDQIVFAKNMLSAHQPHNYDSVLHDLL